VLAFGYPDILATPKEAQELLGSEPLPAAGENVPAAHKRGESCVETGAAFKAAGVVSFYCIDLFPSRGVETAVDLNEPLWPDIEEADRFDLVIDAVTIEHCANVGQALMNAARMVAIGGRVFHSPPVSMVNHGFYNICPTLLADFYEQNGWKVEHLTAFLLKDHVARAVSPRGRTRVEPESLLYFLARRQDSAGPLHWPTQGKYL
jgi:hypothetical protein